MPWKYWALIAILLGVAMLWLATKLSAVAKDNYDWRTVCALALGITFIIIGFLTLLTRLWIAL